MIFFFPIKLPYTIYKPFFPPNLGLFFISFGQLNLFWFEKYQFEKIKFELLVFVTWVCLKSISLFSLKNIFEKKNKKQVFTKFKKYF